ncbi:MAG TPA: hypothetical protein PKA90_02230 [Ignavibacteria bacterium]|nr:hypothetical protein [Ignavibacteria bacterium]HMR39226.1 hypothetical protein [Ignavibacteria bacterium]
MIKLLLFVSIFFLLIRTSYSQNLNIKLSEVGESYAQEYVKPGIDGIGSNINSGFFNTAYVPYNKTKPVEFNFNFSLRFFGTFFPSSSQSFDLSYLDSLEIKGVTRQVQYSVTNAPTVIGDTRAAIATGYFTDNGDPAPPQELIGGIVNTTVLPLFFPQFQFGTIYGTDAAIRFLPKIKVGEYGSFSFFGFAIRHNLDHYFKNAPLNFSIQAGYQINNIDDDTDFRILKGTDYFVNLQASKDFTSVFTLYGGLQLEKYKGEINYVYVQDPNDPNNDIAVSFDQTADDKFRVILGGNLNFGYFNFNLDANISNRFTLTSGLGVGF